MLRYKVPAAACPIRDESDVEGSKRHTDDLLLAYSMNTPLSHRPVKPTTGWLLTVVRLTTMLLS